MDSNKTYFLSLIKSYLNEETPCERKNIDWDYIYKLADIHNVAAIISSQILKLSPDFQPSSEILSKFKQQTGYTLISFEKKEKCTSALKKLLSENDIDYLFVKGAVIKDYYPDKEFRTSGDVDVFIKHCNIDKARSIMQNSNYIIESELSNVLNFNIEGQHTEIHTDKDYDHLYFSDIFSLSIKSENKNEYELDIQTQLLYVLCHIYKHIRTYGVGIRMIMDIDVLIKNIENFNYEKFIEKCEEIGIGKLAKAMFSLSNFIFETPVKADIDFNQDKELFETLANEILDGGSFGFELRNSGNFHMIGNLNRNEKINSIAKAKTIVMTVFPKIEYLRKYYLYLDKYPILYPIACTQRVVRNLFTRRKSAIKTVENIVNTDIESTEKYLRLLEKLGI